MQTAAFVTVGLLVVATGIAMILRMVRPKPSLSPGTVNLPVAAFNIVALGNSGSGKTVLLASMFHQLQAPAPGRPYILNVRGEQNRWLANVLGKVIEAREPWPAGTARGEMREFAFDCAARVPDLTPGDWPTVLRINYLDYAGELLSTTDESAKETGEELHDRIDRADALLLILDGRKVLRFLRGHADGLSYLEAAIQPLVGLVMKARCPAHLVLTKWDVIRDFGEPAGCDDNERLAAVRARLKQIEQLRGLIHERRIDRLIPVSAVGDGFTETDPETGVSIKRDNALLKPINVEVPLAVLIPDLFAMVARQIDDAAGEELLRELRKQTRLSGVEAASLVAQLLSRPAGAAVRAALAAVAGRGIGNEALDLYFNWVGRAYREKAVKIPEIIDDQARQANEWVEGRVAVLQHFHQAVKSFEEQLPAARLVGE